MPTIQHDGCTLAYDIKGQGTNLLFIQGVGVHGNGWLPQTDHFASRYRCISFDNRGLGASTYRQSQYTVETMASDALAIMDATQTEQAHVIGHSLGGLVALQLAILAKQRVKSLILMCTFANGPGVAPLTWRMIWLGMRTQIGTRAMRQRGFMRLVHPPGARFQDVDLDRMMKLFGHDLASQPAMAKQQMRAMRATDLRPQLSQLAGIPTLVISARHDPIAPPALGQEIASGIAGARLKIVEDASHGLPITHAQLTNQLMDDHLASLNH